MPTKEEIKKWLKDMGRDRKWLAEQCAVSVAHIHNWFSISGKIPDSKLELLKRLMEKDEILKDHKTKRAEITLSFVGDEWELIKWCANKKKIPPERWIEDCALASSGAYRRHGLDQYYSSIPSTNEQIIMSGRLEKDIAPPDIID